MELMNIRRSLLSSKNSTGNISAIISHGNELINTGFYPNSCCLARFDAKFDSMQTYGNLYGSTGANNSRFGIQFNSSANGIYSYAWSTSNVNNMSSSIPGNGVRFVSYLSNGFSLFNDGQNATIEATRPLLIFGGYYTENYDKKSAITFYGLQVYDLIKMKIVKNYVPWLDENNIPCVKELETNTLLYNAGSGEFGYIDLDGTVHDNV